MAFRTRSKSRVLDDLVEKLRSLPQNHPDRPRLIRMIIDLNRENRTQAQRQRSICRRQLIGVTAVIGQRTLSEMGPHFRKLASCYLAKFDLSVMQVTFVRRTRDYFLPR
jgi:hypothetical protein